MSTKRMPPVKLSHSAAPLTRAERHREQGAPTVIVGDATGRHVVLTGGAAAAWERQLRAAQRRRAESDER